MIRDVDSGNELSYETEGEICLTGPSIMLGYYKNEKANADVFFDHKGIRYLRTGDLGYATKDGGVVISGRIKRILWGMGSDQIVYRIYPMAIEEVISSCDKVDRCAVVGYRNGNLGYWPIAFVTTNQAMMVKR